MVKQAVAVADKTHPMVHWREEILSRVLTKEQLKIRWKEINYTQEYKQLKLEL